MSPEFKEQMLEWIWRITGRREGVDVFLSRLLKHRRCLPELDPSCCIPRFHETEVIIRQLPLGRWSTPMADVVTIVKAAIGFGSRRILEMGSYRGDTARLLAENTGPDVRICAVDEDPRHGISYRGLPIGSKIDRRVGRLERGLFPAGELFDLIFVDARHDFDSATHDTQIALELLAPEGVILWHDYQFNMFFNGLIRVPEALKQVARQHAVGALAGTWLAIHSRFPGWSTSRLLETGNGIRKEGVWAETSIRG